MKIIKNFSLFIKSSKRISTSSQRNKGIFSVRYSTVFEFFSVRSSTQIMESSTQIINTLNLLDTFFRWFVTRRLIIVIKS